MKYSQTKQITRLECQSPLSDIQAVNGVLYFTVDLGKNGKQRWKNDGTHSVFVAYL